MTLPLAAQFSLEGRVAVITGGAGLLGRKHAEAVAEAGGAPVLLDIPAAPLKEAVVALEASGATALGLACDITDKRQVAACLAQVLKHFARVDALVNNAANNPSVGTGVDSLHLQRFETIGEERWQKDLAVGLTGAFLCCQVFGSHMAEQGGGVIVNVASDLSVIAPDQRIYRQPGVPPEKQPMKPVTYSVVKTGLIGLTRYLATYWAEAGVRVNAISPGGVFNNQNEEFVRKVSQLIPLGRMAAPDEYKATMLYLLSDASRYMTGFNLVIDGGRTCW